MVDMHWLGVHDLRCGPWPNTGLVRLREPCRRDAVSDRQKFG